MEIQTRLLELPENPALVALDLDGTLLNSDHSVSSRNNHVLAKASEQGVYVVLVSGRMHRSILPISNQIGLKNPIISYNGGMVKHATTGKLYNHTPVPAESARKIIDFVDQFGQDLYVTKTQVEYIEFMNLQATKGQALTELADQLKIPILNTVAFGDGYNDKSMMEVAGFSIAMANAVDEIKAISDHVTTSNDDDGIAVAVEKMLFSS